MHVASSWNNQPFVDDMTDRESSEQQLFTASAYLST